MKIIVREGQFFIDGFPVRRSFLLEEGERRLLSYVAKGGCGVAYLSVTGGVLHVEGEGLDVIERREGREIRPLCFHSSERADLLIEAEKERYTVECRVAPAEILVSGSAERTIIAKTPFRAPAIHRIEGQRDTLVRIEARCALGEYLAILALSEGEVRLLLETAGEIRLSGNEVTVKRRLGDLSDRTMTTRYLWRGRGFDETREITRARPHTFRPEEMGRALIEGVIAHDDEALAELLSPDIDAQTIYDYFGEVLAVEAPYSPAPQTAVDVLLLQEGRRVILTYDFDFDASGRIENIRPLDEEEGSR